ncbi:MAG: hypothetical protein DI585_04785 [Pseudomonas fluorescens]|nr:MAG: hypothetical protein DI585_04785 [Pseudomonas fluorescens]
MGRQASNASTHDLESRVANLQFENQRLRATRLQAAQRLGTLLERLQAQQESETSGSQTLEDTVTALQEQAA